MKLGSLCLIPVLVAGSLTSCADGYYARQGTVIGALGGAAAGGIIGSQRGRGLEGAAIGAGLGALAGNAIGHSKDRRRGYYYANHRGYRGYRYPGYYRY